jgi:hypothetical protein
MISSSAKYLLSRKFPARGLLENRVLSACSTTGRFKSSVPEGDEESSHSYAFDVNGEAPSEFVSFGQTPQQGDAKPVLLNAKEHAVGYLSKILNARVYEAAIETDLQEAKNLSNVRPLWKKFDYPFSQFS